jgi:hypothetical protein
MSQTVIQRLAERIRSFGDKNVTKQAIELSRTAIIDTIGVTLAGSVEPCATNLLRTPWAGRPGWWDRGVWRPRRCCHLHPAAASPPDVVIPGVSYELEISHR